MLISKFDLYKPEWLELVFDSRNKEYGAYDLRRDYARNMTRAMGFTFSVLILLTGVIYAFKTDPAAIINREIPPVIVTISPPPIAPQIKKPDPPILAKPLPITHPAPAVPTIKDPVMVVVPDALAQTPVKNADLDNKAIALATTEGKGKGDSVLPDADASGTSGSAPDNNIYTTVGLEVMPFPVGGKEAWSKFLSRNLRYPESAQEQQVSGRVMLSFVIEKDGHLSNIVVDQGAGYGFDEEALRVLKLAKAWKPGIQNGQPVRVKYTIPINFQYNENN